MKTKPNPFAATFLSSKSHYFIWMNISQDLLFIYFQICADKTCWTKLFNNASIHYFVFMMQLFPIIP